MNWPLNSAAYWIRYELTTPLPLLFFKSGIPWASIFLPLIYRYNYLDLPLHHQRSYSHINNVVLENQIGFFFSMIQMLIEVSYCTLFCPCVSFVFQSANLPSYFRGYPRNKDIRLTFSCTKRNHWNLFFCNSECTFSHRFKIAFLVLGPWP